MAVIWRWLVIVCLLGEIARAQPVTASDRLRDGSAAASAGDWQRVTVLVEPLLQQQLPPTDLAEAHRLAGLAAFYQHRAPQAEQHFLAYLRIDLDGRLDPALYPPDVVNFFEDVKQRHAAELRARRPQPRRYWLLNLVPPGGQIQNGDRTKAIIIGGAIGVFTVANITSFFVLRSWCRRVSGDEGSSALCDEKKDRATSAEQLRAVNLVSGVALIATYLYGVYDGVAGYRRHTRESVQPFVSTTPDGGFAGLRGSF